MNKIISAFMTILFCISLTACGETKISEITASEVELIQVADTANNYFNSDEFKSYTELYRTTFGNEPGSPEIINVLTFQYNDVSGYELDLVLFNAKADIAVSENDEVFGFDKIQFAIDNKTGKVYDSATYISQIANYDGVINSEEDAVIMLLSSAVLIDNTNDYIWSEMETSTRFTKDNIKTINELLHK